MPISSQTPIVGYVANGASKTFTFPFVILDAEDLKVSVAGSLVTTGFSIAGVGDRSGGSVTFSAAPAASEAIIIYREVSLERTTDYQENGDLLARVLDDDFDRVWMALQDQLLLASRALRAPIGESLQQLPEASVRALKTLAFNAAGQPVAISRTDDGGTALALDLLDTAPGKGAALVSQPTEAPGEAGPSVFSILRGRIRLADFIGADPSGTTPSDTAIANAIAKAAARGGDEIDMGYGDFLITSKVTRPANVYLVGRGPQATRIRTNGNHRMIESAGSISNVINRGGVIGMTLKGSGQENTGCVGVHEAWTNRSIVEDVITHGTYIGFYASNVWQLKWVNLHPNGAGADQNAVGFWTAEVDPSNQNNAVIATGCVAQDVALYGWRLVNFNGSKFTGCEGMGGVHGWYLGDPTSGTEQVRWGHFVNCLADSTSGHGWRIEKGAASAIRKLQLANCWSGNTGGDGFRIAGASHVTLTNPMTESTAGAAIRFVQSSRCGVSGGDLENYDVASEGTAGITLVDSQYIKTTGVEIYTSSVSAKAWAESGSSDYNVAMGNTLHGGFTKLGAHSKVVRNMGVYGERSGSAQIGASATSVTVTHGMSYAPSLDDITLTLRDNMGAASKAWPSNANATTFDINVNTAPGAVITIGWAIDPLGQ